MSFKYKIKDIWKHYLEKSDGASLKFYTPTVFCFEIFNSKQFLKCETK